MNAFLTRFTKRFAAAALSLSIVFSGSVAAMPQPAIAAEAAKAEQVISTARQYMGVRYEFGAKTGDTSSFDCSSFTQYVFRVNGIDIPRSSKKQSKAGRYVSKKNLERGDLVFFYSPIHHVGIYIGNGEFIHTWGDPGVTVSNLNEGWWKNNYTTARRVM